LHPRPWSVVYCNSAQINQSMVEDRGSSTGRSPTFGISRRRNFCLSSLLTSIGMYCVSIDVSNDARRMDFIGSDVSNDDRSVPPMSGQTALVRRSKAPNSPPAFPCYRQLRCGMGCEREAYAHAWVCTALRKVGRRGCDPFGYDPGTAVLLLPPKQPHQPQPPSSSTQFTRRTDDNNGGDDDAFPPLRRGSMSPPTTTAAAVRASSDGDAAGVYVEG
jgi:hypothetical protein